jgi:hypothetical protein
MALVAERFEVKRLVVLFDLVAQRRELRVIDLVSPKEKAILARLKFQMAARRRAESVQDRGGEGDLSFAGDFDEHGGIVVTLQILSNRKVKLDWFFD